MHFQLEFADFNVRLKNNNELVIISTFSCCVRRTLRNGSKDLISPSSIRAMVDVDTSELKDSIIV